MITCPTCGTQLEDGAKFCLECGTPIPQTKRCIKCGFELPLSAKFCPECGTNQNGSANAAGGSGFSMGDKNVIAGDVIGHKEETHISGNATIIKNEDQTKQVKKCHICGSLVSIVEGFDCPECGQFTCASCFDNDAGCCTNCVEQKEQNNIKRYKDALKMVLADGRIEPSERKELVSLQMQLGISSEKAAQLENEMRNASSKNELTTVEKLSLENARNLFYKEEQTAQALEILEPIYDAHKHEEEILTLYLPILAEVDSERALQIIETLPFDILMSYITAIDIAIKKDELDEAERKYKEAAKIWPENALVKCYQVLLNYALYKKFNQQNFLNKAKELVENLGEAQNELELSMQVRVQMFMQEQNGEEVPEITRQFCDDNQLYFGVMINNPFLSKEENIRIRKEKEDARIAKEAEEKRIAEEKLKEIKELSALQDKILKNEKDYSLEDLLKVEDKFHNSQIQFYICERYIGKEDYDNSFIWANKSADQNYPDGIARVGWHYLRGNGCEKDLQKALELVKKAVSINSSYAQLILGDMYRWGDGVEQDRREAVKWYRLSAEQENTEAQQALAFTYYGDFVSVEKDFEKDFEEAVKLFRLLAERGDAYWQYILGDMYDSGSGVQQDKKEAVKWYRLSAEQGDARAQVNLGWMYESGSGVQRDYKEAEKWYRLSAEQGNARAQVNLGYLYYHGFGDLKIDFKEAKKWYRLSAEQGNARAQVNLGVMCYNGYGGSAPDNKEAVKWYRLSAEQGDACGQANLGYMYYYGAGVQRDYKEAEKWYRLSAEQGNDWAQLNLGKLYFNGEGVEKNIEEAEKWWRLAANQGNTEAAEKLNKCLSKKKWLFHKK